MYRTAFPQIDFILMVWCVSSQNQPAKGTKELTELRIMSHMAISRLVAWYGSQIPVVGW